MYKIPLNYCSLFLSLILTLSLISCLPGKKINGQYRLADDNLNQAVTIKHIKCKKYSIEYLDKTKKVVKLSGEISGNTLIVKWGMTVVNFIFEDDLKAFSFGGLTYKKIEEKNH